MRIAVDAMGGDLGPGVVVQGALQALAALGAGAELFLIGDRTQIESHLTTATRVQVVHAGDVITMEESPAAAVRRKPDSSIGVAVRMLRAREVDAVVSPGNTGAVVSSALLGLGRLQHVQRPAIATLFPTEGPDCVLLDVGATAECKPVHLLQFAAMGTVFARIRLGREHPRVGLLNIGEEPSKGNELAAAAHAMLRDSRLDFAGNVEGRDLLHGKADVVVCDGFTGNVVLKFAESMLGFTRGLLRQEIATSLRLRLGGWLMRPAFNTMKKRLDYQEFGGAPLLGVDGIVLIAHGKSSARAIESAVRAAATLVQHRITERIAAQLEDLGATRLEEHRKGNPS
jgi:glycerol-3-phosphate acyltransferase PlsX